MKRANDRRGGHGVQRPGDERGAIMLMAVFFAVFALGLLYTVVGTAQAVLLRERAQDAADAAALSGAIFYARSMNLLVLINIVMAALLAILVTVKLLEALAILGIGIAGGLAPFTKGASLAMVPPLKATQVKMRTAYHKLKPPVDKGLVVLNRTATAIQRISPGAADAVAEGVLGRWSVSGFVTTGQALPVENDEYRVLCEQAGAMPFAIAESALDALRVPGAGLLVGRLKGRMKSMAGRFSTWFCGDSGSPPTFDEVEEVSYPQPESARACRDAEPDFAAGDLSSLGDMSELAAVESEACRRSQQEAAQAEPHDDTGECQRGHDCSLTGPYERRVADARRDCDPASSPTPIEWDYQERSGTVDYVWNGLVWERKAPSYAGRPARRSSKVVPPCGTSHARVGEGYNVVVRRSDDVAEVRPVCTDEEPPEPPASPDPGRVETVHFREVTHILGCTKRERIDVAVEDVDPGGDGGPERSPKRVVEGVELGDESFQIRAVVRGGAPGAGAGRVVRLALWNRSEPGDPLSRLHDLRGRAFAKAEYFYDGAEERAAWMWNMRWRARLRRFHLGSAETLEELGAACFMAIRGATGCPQLLVRLALLDGRIVH